MMWQDVFAVDSRVCEARFENMSAEKKRDLKPLYLKRRLQLLQASAHLHGQQRDVEAESGKQVIESISDENKTIELQRANSKESYQPVMRNKRYISLRVKLLKRQFGLPADVLSLKSLSLSSPVSQPPSVRFNDPDLLNENMDEDVEMNILSERPKLQHQLSSKSIAKSATTEECNSFNRVHQILDSIHRSQVTRLMFTQMQMMAKDYESNQLKFCIVSSSLDGKISISNLDPESAEAPIILSHPDGILDFDLSSSNSDGLCDEDRMLVSACADGSVLLWHLKTGKELRRLTCSKQMQHQHPMNLGDFKNNSQIMRITGVRFLPKNSNLVACATSGGLIRLLNVSTGKFLLEGSGHTTGKPSCIEIDPRTGASHQSLLWSGSDRGYIESFRLLESGEGSKGGGGKIKKGCRVAVQQARQYPVTSISVTKDVSFLLITVASSENLYLFKITDTFGTVTPFRAFNTGADGTGNASVLRCAGFTQKSHLESVFSQAVRGIKQESKIAANAKAVTGSEDGSVVFFDLERNWKPCIDKLSGHSKPVVSVVFSDDEKYLASADTSGQIIVWKKS